MEGYSKKRIVIGLFLVIIIGLLLLIFLAIKEVGHIGLIPTGNVDIFNIECNQDDNNCDCTGTNKNDDNNNYNNTNNATNDSNASDTTTSSDSLVSSDEEVFGEGGFEVFDNDTSWNSTNELRIFSNPAYEFRSIISPGSTNAYQFIVNNNQTYNIKYNISFIEDNEHQINMQYRLKRNGEYILGSNSKWLKITDGNFQGFKLMSKTRDLYTLEWKWVDNDNDTEVAYLKANYVLKINIKAST